MSACIVWMDYEHAKVFKLSASGIEKKMMHHKSAPPHDAHHDSFKHNAEERFFHEIASEIGNSEEVLVFGAGLAKNHFKTHLEKHHHTDLAKHLVGVEPLDHLTDNQILEAGRKFFKKYNTYKVSV